MRHNWKFKWQKLLSLLLSVIVTAGSLNLQLVTAFAANQRVSAEEASIETEISEEMTKDVQTVNSETDNKDGAIIDEMYGDGEQEYTYQGTTFLYSGNTITGYKGTPADNLVFPDTIEGVPIQYIGKYAFDGCSNITNIAFPKRLLEIKMYAFRGTSITELILPEYLTTIGDAGFWNNKSLQRIFVPAGLSDLPHSSMYCAFNGCSSVTSIEFEDGITEIPSWLAYGLTSITEISIPDTVTKIGDHAFTETGISSLIIPSSVQTIGGNSFSNCSSLNSITFSNGLLDIDDNAFYGTGISELILPKTIKTIGDRGFGNCLRLRRIYVPSSLENLPWNSIYTAFNGCSSVTSLEFEEGITTIPANLALGLESITDVTIPETVTTIGSSAFSDTGIDSIIIPPSVQTIGGGAFRNCDYLREINFSNGLINIENNAFSNTPITELKLPETLTTLGINVFENCTKLKKVYIPKSLTDLWENPGYAPFIGCTSLSTVSFQEGITYIPYALFYGVSSLKVIDIPETVTEIGTYAFSGTGISSLTIPSSVRTIRERAFKDCSLLNNITFSDGLIRINGYAFENTAITELNLPNTLTTLGINCFLNCKKLKKVYIPISLTDLWGNTGYAPFVGCVALTDIEFQEGIVRIPGYLFSKVSSIRALSIPDSVVEIGPNTFYGCDGINRVTLPTTLEIVRESAFEGCSGLENSGEVIYEGTENAWNEITIERKNDPLLAARRSYLNKAINRVVSFDSNGGTKVYSIKVEKGHTVAKPEDPTRDGFRFDGWYKEKQLSTPWDFENDIVNASLILYAKWVSSSEKVFSVTYDANGGKGDVPVDNVLYSTSDKAIVLSANGLTKKGYTFKGWALNADGSGTLYQANDELDVEKNITLYAVWETVSGEYHVTYNLNGGSGTLPVDSNTYKTGDNVTVLAGIDLVKDGFEFKGWTLNLDGSGKNYKAGDVIENIEGDVILYAVWNPNGKFMVTYDGNGATGIVPVDTTEYESGTVVNILGADTLEKEGSTFAGWSLNSDGSGRLYKPGAGDLTISDNITLYAVWIEKYIVTYDANGGTGNVPVDNKTYTSGENVTVLDAGSLTKKGCFFRGWSHYVDNVEIVYKEGDVISGINGDIYLVAKWEEKVFTLGRDNNSFGNTRNNFHETYAFINDDYFNKLDSLAKDEKHKKEMRLGLGEQWRGSCFGIASTIGLVYSEFLGISDIANTTVNYYHDLPRPIDDNKLYDTIQFYQNGFHIFYRDSLISYIYKDTNSNNLPSFLKKLVERTADNNVVVFSYIVGDSGHAILAVNSEFDEDNNQYKVKLYDENTAGYIYNPESFSEMTVSDDFSSFSFILKNGIKVQDDYTWLIMTDPKKLPLALDTESIKDKGSGATDTEKKHTILRLLLKSNTQVENSKGEKLILKNGRYSGTMHIYDAFCIPFDDNAEIRFEVDESDWFRVVSDDMSTAIVTDEKAIRLSGSGIDSAELSVKDEKIDIQGSNYTFDAAIMGKGSDNLLSLKATTTGDTSVSVQGDTVTVSTTGALTDVSSITYTDNNSKEEKIEISEDGKEASAKHTEIPEKSGMDPEAELTEDNELYLVKGQTYKMAGTGWRVDGGAKDVTITAKNGITTVAAKKVSQDGVNISNGVDTYKVFVSEPTATINNNKSAKLVVGNTAEIKISGISDKLLDKYSVAWTSAKTEVATVTPSSGKAATVTAIGKGSTNITAYVGGKAYNCKVTVIDDTKNVPKIVDTSAEITLNPMQTVSLKYSGFIGKNAEWTSGDLNTMDVVERDKKGNPTASGNGIVKIVKKTGAITAIGEGDTTIIGTDKNGKSVTLHIMVKPVPTNPVVYVRCGKSVTLKAPKLNNKYTEWKLERGDDLISNQIVKGKVVALASLPESPKADHALVTCKFKPYTYGNGFNYSYKVFVENPSLKTDKGLIAGTKKGQYALNLKKGETFSLKDQYKGIYRGVIWKNSKPAIAYIDENGVIHANKAGSAGSTNLTVSIGGVSLKVTVNIAGE